MASLADARMQNVQSSVDVYFSLHLIIRHGDKVGAKVKAARAQSQTWRTRPLSGDFHIDWVSMEAVQSVAGRVLC